MVKTKKVFCNPERVEYVIKNLIKKLFNPFRVAEMLNCKPPDTPAATHILALRA
jgi:hypothetical protein